MRELLESAKSGDRRAQSQLFRVLMSDVRVGRAIRSLTYEKSVLEKDDVKAEFWVGVLRGIPVVNHDMGDPVLHLIQRGVWQVKSVVRVELGKRIVQTCMACHKLNSTYNFERKCNSCSGPVENVGRHEGLGELDFPDRRTQTDRRTHVCVNKALSPTQERVLELLLQACLDHSEHPQADIARVMGVSRQRIQQQIDKVRPFITVILP